MPVRKKTGKSRNTWLKDVASVQLRRKICVFRRKQAISKICTICPCKRTNEILTVLKLRKLLDVGGSRPYGRNPPRQENSGPPRVLRGQGRALFLLGSSNDIGPGQSGHALRTFCACPVHFASDECAGMLPRGNGSAEVRINPSASYFMTFRNPCSRHRPRRAWRFLRRHRATV